MLLERQFHLPEFDSFTVNDEVRLLLNGFRELPEDLQLSYNVILILSLIVMFIAFEGVELIRCWRVHGATTGRLRNLYIHIMMLVTHIRAAQLLLGGLLLVQFAIRGVQSGTFGGSVFIGGLWDLEQGVDGELDNPLSRCEQAVDEAGACSSRMVTCRSRPSLTSLEHCADAIGLTKLSFVPTVYWLDEGPTDPPAGFDQSCEGFGADLSGYYCYDRYRSTKVSHFCLVRTWEDILNHTCQEPQARDIRIWQLLLARCLNRAVGKGLSVEVNLRVDDGRTLNGWRNTILFSPTTMYGNYSYSSAFIEPLVEILSSTDYVGEVSLTVAGEMGASLVHHADEWLALVNRAREQIGGARPGAAPPLVGIQLNNNKLCGCHSVGFVGSYEEFIGSFESFDPEALGIDVDAFVGLLKGSDYIGISAYVSMEPESIGSAPCEFESLLARLDDELKFFNTSLADITSAGTRLQYSETGVGGGASQDGRTPATTVAEAARRPYWGIQGPPKEDESNDPFRMDLCDESGACSDTNEIREWRRSFYPRLQRVPGWRGGLPVVRIH